MFPQQRLGFSPVPRPIRPADITYKPKPIKGHLIQGHRSMSMTGAAETLPRPASTGSTFQPKGAVFKVHRPRPKPEPLTLPKTDSGDSRPSSVKSDSNIPMMQREASSNKGDTRNNSTAPQLQSDGFKAGHKSMNHVKTIHNITMTTPDKYGIIMSSNVQTHLSKNNKGAMMGKMTSKVHKGSTPKSTAMPIIATNFSQPQPNKAAVPTTSIIGTMSRSASISGPCSSNMPISIASKPANSVPLKVNTTLAALNLQAPSVVAPAVQPTGAVFLPRAITPQYGALTVLNTGLASSVTKSTQNGNQGYITTPLHSVTPNQSGAPQYQATPGTPGVHTPTAVLTNLVLKAPTMAPPSTQTVQALVGPQVQSVQVTQNQSLQSQVLTAPRAPTHVQYILPSFALQTGPNGKVQNLVALPTTPVQAGNIQLTIPGQQLVQTIPQQKVQIGSQVQGAVKFAAASAAMTIPSTPTTPTTPHLTHPSLLQPAKIIMQAAQQQVMSSQQATQQPTVQVNSRQQPTVQVNNSLQYR